jgi:hypothetical protein
LVFLQSFHLPGVHRTFYIFHYSCSSLHGHYGACKQTKVSRLQKQIIKYVYPQKGFSSTLPVMCTRVAVSHNFQA